MTAPRTPAEREAMVAREAEQRCVRYGRPMMGIVVPCQSCRDEADAAIPPVSPAPALVTADALSKATAGGYWPRTFSPEYFDKLLATLRHYEAEVGRLGDEAKAWDGTCQQAMQNWKTADVRRKEAEEALARSAPFAALGRSLAETPEGQAPSTSAIIVVTGKLRDDLDAARAALAEEREPEWSEPAPSGNRYRMRGGKVEARRSWMAPEVRFEPDAIPLDDAEVVAALLKGVTP